VGWVTAAVQSIDQKDSRMPHAQWALAGSAHLGPRQYMWLLQTHHELIWKSESMEPTKCCLGPLLPSNI